MDENKPVSLGQLLRAKSGGTRMEVEYPPMRTMSEDAYRTFGDPEPGTDEAWDTLTEIEKNYFRYLRNNGGRDPLAGGKSLSDLLRDREAINAETVERQPRPLLPPTDADDVEFKDL
jgi:hypothetical protein